MERIPSSLWIIVGLLFLFWLLAFSWLDIKTYSLKSYIVGCTVFSITYLFSLARELDDPAKAALRLSFKPFEQRFLNSERLIISPESKPQKLEYEEPTVRLSPFIVLSFRPALLAITVFVLFNYL